MSGLLFLQRGKRPLLPGSVSLGMVLILAASDKLFHTNRIRKGTYGYVLHFQAPVSMAAQSGESSTLGDPELLALQPQLDALYTKYATAEFIPTDPAGAILQYIGAGVLIHS